jgi:hypothetical protein
MVFHYDSLNGLEWDVCQASTYQRYRGYSNGARQDNLNGLEYCNCK